MVKEEKKKKKNKVEIIIYQAKSGAIELRGDFDKDTIWTSQAQMAKIFDVTPQNITLHLHKIYKEGELDVRTTCKDYLQVQKEGNREIKRNIKVYNLDVVIAVGYRINSIVGTKFRRWATKTLKDYILKGYAINENRLLETREKFNELQKTIEFLRNKSQKEQLLGQEGEILSLLSDYSKTLSTLEQYDRGALKEIKGRKNKFVLNYEASLEIVAELKKELIVKKEAGELFGQERGGSFEGVIKGLYQSFGGKEVYPSIEDKASHLLYFVIKDHVFSDGNKRTAAFLFVYFLDKNNYLFKKSGERKINDNALAALALLVAESEPKEKDMMIKLIKTLITE